MKKNKNLKEQILKEKMDFERTLSDQLVLNLQTWHSVVTSYLRDKQSAFVYKTRTSPFLYSICFSHFS
jgi:hypothetical protein